MPAVTGDQAQGNTNSKDDILVVSTRVARPGYTSPTPQTDLSAADIAKKSTTDIADIVNLVPAMRASYTSTSSDNRQFAPGAAYAELRGLGPIRTLVLIDKERVVPEIPTFSVGISYQIDLNIIPTIAVQSLEVVTGGASSSWGSDALAGVVNMQLYKKYDGIKVDLSTGISEQGDAASYSAGLLFGKSFADDRGHFVLAGTYDKGNGSDDVLSRDWAASAPYAVANPACTGCFISGTGYQYATTVPGGVITAGRLTNNAATTLLNGTAFGAGGTPYRFPYGTFVNGANMLGGSVPGNYPQAGVKLLPKTERGTIYGYADYAVTDSFKLHLTGIYAKQNAEQGTKQFFNTYTIRTGNPYIPSTTQGIMTANNIASFTVGVLHNDLNGGRLTQYIDRTTWRGSAGFSWALSDKWSVDGYAAYGRSRAYYTFSGLLNKTKAAQAADAILSGGQIVCRDASNGCVPLNVLGTNVASAAALDFITQKDSWSLVDYRQGATALNVTGELFKTWAGPISVAFGAEYRWEKQIDRNDAVQRSGVLADFANQDFSGKFNVKEAYIEGVIPLAKDIPFIESFDLNGSYRHADYSTVGGANVWKIGATWKVGGGLMLRATKSRDFRAPNLTELFYPSTLSNANTVVPGQSQLANLYNGGNRDLQPEVSKSTIIGFTYRPRFFRGFGMTVDYFKLDLQNLIVSAGGANILQACSLGYQISCDQIVKNSAGIVTDIIGGFSNISTVDMSGIDAELSYSTSLSKIGLPGTLDLRAFGTYTRKLAYQQFPGGAFIDYSRQTEAGVAIRSGFYTPKFKSTVSAGYNSDSFRISLDWNHISPSKADVTLTTAQYALNNIPAYELFNLNAGVSIGPDRRFELYAGVNNLFDKDPPFAPNLILFTPTNPAVYDVLGRRYKVGVRVKF